MASSVGNKLSSYQRLRNEEEESSDERTLERAIKKAKARLKLRALAGRKRPKVRVPRLRRFLRKRIRLFSRFRVSWREALKKLKSGHGHMNDLFGGNYLFMQYNPTPFIRCGDHKPYMGHALRGLPSTTYSLRKIA